MKKGILKKIIKLLIIIIIPLAAGVVTGSYAYKRYQPRYFDLYMNDASQEDTEDRLISYLKYTNQKLEYKEKDEGYEFYYSNDFSNKYGNLFTLSIIRGSKVVEEKDFNKAGQYQGMKDVYYATYYFAVYNVQYDTLAKTLDPTEEHKLVYTEIPTLSIEIQDKNDEEKTKNFDLSTVSSVSGAENPVIIYDYGFGPELDSKGNKFNTNKNILTSMRYYVLQATDLAGYSKELDIKVRVNSNWAGDDQVHEEAVKFTLDNMYNNKDLNDAIDKKDPIKTVFDDFNDGYDKDIFKAGYTKYAFGHYIWWEVLIAVALFGIVCVSFVLVWNSEDEKELKKKNNK